jgi:hypothetical protein
LEAGRKEARSQKKRTKNRRSGKQPRERRGRADSALPYAHLELKLELLIRMESLGFLQKGLLGLHYIRILNAGISGTHRNALFTIKKADAFRALFGNYIIKLLGFGGMRFAIQLIILATGIDCLIRAFRLAGAATNALVIDHQRHLENPPNKLNRMNLHHKASFASAILALLIKIKQIDFLRGHNTRLLIRTVQYPGQSPKAGYLPP